VLQGCSRCPRRGRRTSQGRRADRMRAAFMRIRSAGNGFWRAYVRERDRDGERLAGKVRRLRGCHDDADCRVVDGGHPLSRSRTPLESERDGRYARMSTWLGVDALMSDSEFHPIYHLLKTKMQPQELLVISTSIRDLVRFCRALSLPSSLYIIKSKIRLPHPHRSRPRFSYATMTPLESDLLLHLGWTTCELLENCRFLFSSMVRPPRSRYDPDPQVR